MRRVAAHLALALGGVALALLALELGLRALDGLAAGPSEPTAPAADDPRLAELPELAGGILDLAKPGQRGRFAGVLHRTNSLGMRGPEVSRRPEPGVLRIVLTGDSIAMGQGVEESETYAARLARLLSRSGTRVEVLNLGVSGYNVLQAVGRLERLGLSHAPRLVVYGYTLNDIEGPYYQATPEAERRAYLRRLRRFEDSPSRLWAALWPRSVALASAWRPAPGSYEYALERNYLHNPEAWAQVTRGLARLARISSERELCVVVLVHTHVQQLVLGHPLRRFYELVGEAAREQGLAVVQSYPEFRGRSAAGLRLSAIDTHPNAEGHRLLAEALARGIRELPPACGLPAGL